MRRMKAGPSARLVAPRTDEIQFYSKYRMATLLIARLELELIEQPRTALGALAELLAPELLDLQLQVDDQRPIVSCPGPQARRFGGYSGNVRAPQPAPRRAPAAAASD